MGACLIYIARTKLYRFADSHVHMRTVWSIEIELFMSLTYTALS